MHLQYKSLPFAAKAKGAGDGSTFEGLASVYHVLDTYNEIVAPGAFAVTLPDFLSRGVIRAQHRVTIGKPTDAREQPEGLWIAGRISDTAAGRDTKVLLKDEVVKSLSIGFYPGPSTTLPTQADVLDYWKKADYSPSPEEIERSVYGARVLNAVDLFEVSIVDFPANDRCDITAVKAGTGHLIALADLLAQARSDALQAKSGRVLSAANRDRLQAHCEALRAVAGDLDALLSSTAPAPDADAPDPDEAAKARAAALRSARDFLLIARLA